MIIDIVSIAHKIIDLSFFQIIKNLLIAFEYKDPKNPNHDRLDLHDNDSLNNSILTIAINFSFILCSFIVKNF